ncbi:MAG: hypothetical protein ABIV21_02540 [Pyrinomonadaceae bacterium]
MADDKITVVDWTAVNTAIGAVSGIVVLAAAYLRTFIRGELNLMENKLMTQIDTKFSTKELMEIQIDEVKRRLDSIERLMEAIRIKKVKDDDNDR